MCRIVRRKHRDPNEHPKLHGVRDVLVGGFLGIARKWLGDFVAATLFVKHFVVEGKSEQHQNRDEAVDGNPEDGHRSPPKPVSYGRRLSLRYAFPATGGTDFRHKLPEFATTKRDGLASGRLRFGSKLCDRRGGIHARTDA